MRRKAWARTLVLTVLTAMVGARWAMAQGTTRKAAPPSNSVPKSRPATNPPAQHQPATPPPVSPADAAKMKQLLLDWERQSSRLKTLKVKIQRVDKSPAWGDEEFEGVAFLESPNRAFLNFQRKIADPKPGQPALVDKERIVCTGKEVWQYLCDTKQVLIFPLDRQNQKQVLEEGPLPFLFNMKAAEAEARYEMTLVPGDKDPNNYIISVFPKLQVDREAFRKALLSLSKKQFIPNRIMLFSPDGASTKDFRLSEIRVNEEIPERNFVGQTMPKPWTVVRDPGNTSKAEEAAPAVGTANRKPAAAAPPRR